MGMGVDSVSLPSFFPIYLCCLLSLLPVAFLCLLFILWFSFLYFSGFLFSLYFFPACVVIFLLVLMNLLFSCSPWERTRLLSLYSSIFKRVFSRSAAWYFYGLLSIRWGMAWKSAVILLIKFCFYEILWVTTNNRMAEKYLPFCHPLPIFTYNGFRARKCVLYEIQCIRLVTCQMGWPGKHVFA